MKVTANWKAQYIPDRVLTDLPWVQSDLSFLGFKFSFTSSVYLLVSVKQVRIICAVTESSINGSCCNLSNKLRVSRNVLCWHCVLSATGLSSCMYSCVKNGWTPVIGCRYMSNHFYDVMDPLLVPLDGGFCEPVNGFARFRVISSLEACILVGHFTA